MPSSPQHMPSHLAEGQAQPEHRQQAEQQAGWGMLHAACCMHQETCDSLLAASSRALHLRQIMRSTAGHGCTVSHSCPAATHLTRGTPPAPPGPQGAQA